MNDDYADAMATLEETVDQAVNRAMAIDPRLSNKEIADELRRIAQGWEDAA